MGRHRALVSKQRMWLLTIVLLAIFFICCTAALLWFVYPQFVRFSQTTVPDEDIVFPLKTFFATKDFVGAKGTLTAD
jgi:hypothetical protein